MPEFVINSIRQYDDKGKLFYEVHLYPRTNCKNPDYPMSDNQRRIGSLNNCKEALARAEAMGYKKAVGCAFCCADSHKK